MSHWLFHLDGHPDVAQALCRDTALINAAFTRRSFPDGETYVRVDEAYRDQTAFILCSLDRPNDKLIVLWLLCNTLKEMGVSHIVLLAPYLAYMRQDTRFTAGEAVSSRYIARWLSAMVDVLITVDPHLHRYRALDEIYTIPSLALHSASAVSEWVRDHLQRPLLIGPDEESRQWVSAIATLAGAPFTVLEKQRLGDDRVRVSIPQVKRYLSHRPVLVDDIISTGQTMMATMTHLKQLGMAAPVCIGVHGLFIDRADQALLAAGAQQVVTTNSIVHATNRIDLSRLLTQAVNDYLHQLDRGC